MIQLDVQQDLSEVLEYVSADFPVRSHVVDLAQFDRCTSECHWHDDLEFLLVLDGGMTYFVSGESYRLTPGMGIFVNAGRLHYGAAGQSGHCRHVFVVIGQELFPQHNLLYKKYVAPLIDDANADAVALSPDISWQKELLCAIEAAAEAIKRHEAGYELLLMSSLHQMLLLLYSHTVPDSRPESQLSRESSSFKQMVDFIRRHYGERVQLSDIAAAGSVCRNKCCALFRQTLGQSPIAYLTDYRLRRSAELLSGSAMTVTEIAFVCGFNSTSYFGVQFRNTYGVSPREYRIQRRKDAGKTIE